MDRPSPERRAQLNALKLSALVRDVRSGDAPIDEPAPSLSPAPFPGGAALSVGDTAWVLLDENPARGLGGALAWAVRSGATTLNIVAESSTGVLARRAEAFDRDVKVWHADGRALIPAIPEPLPAPAAPSADHLGLVELIERAGAVARVEHGVVVGEIDGLEVCRVVTDEVTGAARLDVGVGAHDREAFAMLHGDIPTIDALVGVIEAVRPHRAPGAPPHPLNRLAAERALRERILATPAVIGATGLSAAEPPLPRPNVKDPVPCVAVGAASDGRPLVAVFSTGIDLDVVPFAADARRYHAPDDGVTADVDLVVVVPERDRHPVTVLLGELLVEPARVVAWTA